MSARARLFLVALVALLAILAVDWLRGWFAIDRCLDRGGRWDYALDRCEDMRDF